MGAPKVLNNTRRPWPVQVQFAIFRGNGNRTELGRSMWEFQELPGTALAFAGAGLALE